MDSEDIQTMEQIRQRLVALSGNIRQALVQFHQSEAPPSWNQIHTVQKSISTHLKQMQKILGDEEKARFLQSAHAFPTSKFPFDQENIVGNLLRKRLDPDVSTWADKARVKGALLERGDAGNMPLQDWETLWDWAAPEANSIIREVMLGLKDTTEDDEDEEEDEEEDDSAGHNMDVDLKRPPTTLANGPAMPLDQLLAFSVSGSIPQRRNVPTGTR